MLDPLPSSRWNFTTAAHLLNRAGFGGTSAEIERLEKMGLDAAVDQLVEYEKTPDTTANPEWAKPDAERREKFQALRVASMEERKKMQQEERMKQRRRVLELRGWWLERMARGPRPLQEKLTLFWHGHFATSVQKVKDAYLMWLQNETFRSLASGHWTQMLMAVTKDPAMLVWLDQGQSRKLHPNENYAREVMESFTLGEGHYTELDIAEAARAFTGLAYDRVQQTSDFRYRNHDDGSKTVLGKEGDLTWTDVLQQIVAQPQAGCFICAKLWSFFATERPGDQLVDSLAAVFRKSGDRFKPLLHVLFRSQEFYADTVIRSQVKSPVQWLVGSVKMLERGLPPAPVASNWLANLGQDLFAPPNVKGWDGGISWITTNNLLARYNQAEMLVQGSGRLELNSNRKAAKFMERRFNRSQGKASPIAVGEMFPPPERGQKDLLIAALERRFVQGRLKPRQEQVLRDYLDERGTLEDEDILEIIRLTMSTPEYQLTWNYEHRTFLSNPARFPAHDHADGGFELDRAGISLPHVRCAPSRSG